MERIGQVCKLLAIDATTLRRYERERKIPKARRTAMGFRVYSGEDVEALRSTIKTIRQDRLRGLDR